jgi:hypothetical protein
MRRITESTFGLALLGLTLILGLAGLITGIRAVGDPPALFGAAVVAAIGAIGVALDEQHRMPGRYRWTEALLGRALVGLAVLLGIVSLYLAVGDSAYRNLWLALAVIVDLVGLAAILDSHRLAVARIGGIATRPLSDGVLGAIAAAVGLGAGTIGFVAGQFDSPDAAPWLDAGVVFALLAVALMFDEQAHVAGRVRKRK